jgi:hypothetical protein
MSAFDLRLKPLTAFKWMISNPLDVTLPPLLDSTS